MLRYFGILLGLVVLSPFVLVLLVFAIVACIPILLLLVILIPYIIAVFVIDLVLEK